MDPVEIGCEDKDWIPLGQDAAQWRGHLERVIHLRISKQTDNLGISTTMIF
jgi:hypothetical protein